MPYSRSLALPSSVIQSVVQAGDSSITARASGAIFPLGNSTKDEVRADAAARNFAVAAKPDSHDVCFIPSGDTAGWLRDRLGSSPGPIV